MKTKKNEKGKKTNNQKCYSGRTANARTEII